MYKYWVGVWTLDIFPKNENETSFYTKLINILLSVQTPRFTNIHDSYVKNSFHLPFDIWIMNISELEPEYLEFIKKQKYGTPKAFTKAHSYEELEAYFAGQGSCLLPKN